MAPIATNPTTATHRFPVTPRIIWAMACQTLRQSLRRKVLLVLLFFFATLFIGGRILPWADPVRRLEAFITLCLYSFWFFGVIVAVFLAATVLPEDRRTKTITTVLTKPVGRLNYLLGRVLGFAMTLGIILLVMGVVSWAFIRWEGSVIERRTGRADLLAGKRGVDASEVILREGDKIHAFSADETPRLVGSTRQELVFSFRSGLDRLGPGDRRIEMTPNIATSEKLPKTGAVVTIENPVTKERVQFDDQRLDAERLTTVTFPATLVDPTAGVNVTVRRTESGTYVRFLPGAFQLMLPPVPFECSYFKAVLMVYLSFLLVIIISITASTFLSAWVAVLLSGVALVFAAFQSVILEFMQGLKGVNVGLLGRHAYVHSHGPVAPAAPDPLFIVVLNKCYYGLMWMLTHIFPSFGGFDASDFLTTARDVPASVVFSALVVFVGYGTCYLALAHVIFRRREISP